MLGDFLAINLEVKESPFQVSPPSISVSAAATADEVIGEHVTCMVLWSIAETNLFAGQVMPFRGAHLIPPVPAPEDELKPTKTGLSMSMSAQVKVLDETVVASLGISIEIFCAEILLSAESLAQEYFNVAISGAPFTVELPTVPMPTSVIAILHLEPASEPGNSRSRKLKPARLIVQVAVSVAPTCVQLKVLG